jgi:formate hydrogenlyase subunit 6/NADH:ubiquinone oxidoreductase subunit I
MDALRLVDSQEATNKKGKASLLDGGKCIGCGVCVYKCPSESLILERREEVYHPPKDVREWMERWLKDKKAAAQSKDKAEKSD